MLPCHFPLASQPQLPSQGLRGGPQAQAPSPVTFPARPMTEESGECICFTPVTISFNLSMPRLRVEPSNFIYLFLFLFIFCSV